VVQACVQTPAVCILEPEVDLGTIYRDSATTATITLRNLTSLPTTFYAPDVDGGGGGGGGPAVSLRFSPQTGLLAPGGDRTITMTFVGALVGEVSQSAKVVIGGASVPLATRVRATLIGASVAFLIKPLALDDGIVPRTAVPRQLEHAATLTLDDGAGAVAVVGPPHLPDVAEEAARAHSPPPPPTAEEVLQFGVVRANSLDVVRELLITNTSSVFVDMAFRVLGFAAAPAPPTPTAPSSAPSSARSKLRSASGGGGGNDDRGGSGRLARSSGGRSAGKMAPAPPASARTTMPSFLRRRAAGTAGAKPTSAATTAGGGAGPIITAARDLLTKPYGAARAAMGRREQRKRAALALSTDLGAAFEVTPPTATIGPNSTVTVRIQCHTDTWGRYRDVLRCTSSAVADRDIPIEVDVIGATLALQTGGTDPAGPVVIRMPQVTTCKQPQLAGSPDPPPPPLAGAAAETASTAETALALTSSDSAAAAAGGRHPSCSAEKTMRLVNPCPFDVIVRWETYFVDPASPTLVDFLLYPDGDGDEVTCRTRPHEGARADRPFRVVTSSSTTTCLGRERNMSADAVTVGFKSDVAGEFLGLVRGVITMAGAHNLPAQHSSHFHHNLPAQPSSTTFITLPSQPSSRFQRIE
jgi:hypothetical protein